MHVAYLNIYPNYYTSNIQFILEDDDLHQSEAIYSFLSPSSENLKQQATVSPKKSKFSLLTLFKPYVTLFIFASQRYICMFF